MKRATRSVFGKNRKISPLQLALLAAAIVVGIIIIVFIAEYRPPEPESRHAPFFPTQLSRHA